jgi:hypothetical protein
MKQLISTPRSVFGSALLALVCSAFLPGAAWAQYEISWYTIDGGGAMFTTAGAYELSGTIGQPDAGFLDGGGAYDLYGGFWVPSSCAAYVPCDANCDGAVNFDDINAFVVALSGEAGYLATFPACDWLCNCDINLDGAVNFDDINPFVACLSGG